MHSEESNITLKYPQWVLFLIMGILAACSPTLRLATPPSSVIYKEVPVVRLKHDTTVLVERHITQEQYRKYLQDFYKTNFDKLLAPQFDKLNDIISKQASSIHEMSNTIVNMRIRSIRRNDSMQYVINNERTESLRLQREANRQQRIQVNQNAEQIKKLNNVTLLIEIAIGSIILVLGIIGMVLYWLYFEIKRLKRKINYA